MIRVNHAEHLARFVGLELAPGDWVAVTQDQIDQFAALVGDRQWIHVDAERAARELPEKRTIVPGDLLLARIPFLLQQAYRVEGARQRRVAALRKVRFRQSISVRQRFRLRTCFLAVVNRRILTIVETECRLEVEGGASAVTLHRTDIFFTCDKAHMSAG